MRAIETFEHNGCTIEIHRDQNAESPREWDNLGVLVCFNRNYDLGDKRHAFSSQDELIEFCKRQDVIALPVFLSEHSGLRMTTDSSGLAANDPDSWDWGQVGMIYVTYENIRKEFGSITESILERALTCLRDEIEVIDQYLSGDVYGFLIKSADKCDSCGHTEAKVVGSCWGFYDFEDCKKEAIHTCLEKAS